jgi:hypothetical protein
MSMEHWGITDVLGETPVPLPPCDPHRLHMDWPRNEPGPLPSQTVDHNGPSHSIIFIYPENRKLYREITEITVDIKFCYILLQTIRREHFPAGVSIKRLKFETCVATLETLWKESVTFTSVWWRLNRPIYSSNVYIIKIMKKSIEIFFLQIFYSYRRKE